MQQLHTKKLEKIKSRTVISLMSSTVSYAYISMAKAYISQSEISL